MTYFCLPRAPICRVTPQSIASTTWRCVAMRGSAPPVKRHIPAWGKTERVRARHLCFLCVLLMPQGLLGRTRIRACLSLHTFSQSVLKGSNFTIGIKHKCMTLYSNSGSIFIHMNAICSPKWDSCSSSLVTLFSKKVLVTLAFVSIATRSGTRGPNRQTSTSTCGRRTYNVCVCVGGGDTKASVKTMQPFSLVQAALHPLHMESKSDRFSID